MAFDNTITEHDLDREGQAFVSSFRNADLEPDLAVDGLSDSLLARLLRLFKLA